MRELYSRIDPRTLMPIIIDPRTLMPIIIDPRKLMPIIEGGAGRRKLFATRSLFAVF
jgi:hypothetical protein